jgi:hypothetical protein
LRFLHGLHVCPQLFCWSIDSRNHFLVSDVCPYLSPKYLFSALSLHWIVTSFLSFVQTQDLSSCQCASNRMQIMASLESSMQQSEKLHRLETETCSRKRLSLEHIFIERKEMICSCRFLTRSCRLYWHSDYSPSVLRSYCRNKLADPFLPQVVDKLASVIMRHRADLWTLKIRGADSLERNWFFHYNDFAVLFVLLSSLTSFSCLVNHPSAVFAYYLSFS